MALSRVIPAVVALACLSACSSSSSARAGATGSGSPSATSAASTSAGSTGGATSAPADASGPPTGLALPSGIATDKPCGGLKTADVSAAVGFAAHEPLTETTGPITICQYSGPVGSAALVRVEKGMGADAFKAAQTALDTAGQKTTALSGVGEQAYSSVLNPNGKNVAYTVGALQGNSDVLVTVAGSSASIGTATALAQAVLAGYGM